VDGCSTSGPVRTPSAFSVSKKFAASTAFKERLNQLLTQPLGKQPVAKDLHCDSNRAGERTSAARADFRRDAAPELSEECNC